VALSRRPRGGANARPSCRQLPLFRIRFFSPAVVDANGWRHAGTELVLGDTRLCTLADLDHWNAADYLRQWNDGIARLAHGADSTALMTAYRGRGSRAHVMWALWRGATHLYIQQHAVLEDELDAPFDPAIPYAHVGGHVAATASRLPIPEWCVSIEDLSAALLGFRKP
jgi:hypothetical protein